METLSNEVLLGIFDYVSLKIPIRRVCKKFYRLYPDDTMSLYPWCSDLSNIKLVEKMGLMPSSKTLEYAAITDCRNIISYYITTIPDIPNTSKEKIVKLACKNKSEKVVSAMMFGCSVFQFMDWIKWVCKYNLEKVFTKLTKDPFSGTVKTLKNSHGVLSEISQELCLGGYGTNVYNFEMGFSNGNSYTSINIPVEFKIAISYGRHLLLRKLVRQYSFKYIIKNIILIGEPNAINYLKNQGISVPSLYTIVSIAIKFGKLNFVKWATNHSEWKYMDKSSMILLLKRSIEENRFLMFKTLHSISGISEKNINEWVMGEPLKTRAINWIHSESEPEFMKSSIAKYLDDIFNERFEEESDGSDDSDESDD